MQLNTIFSPSLAAKVELLKSRRQDLQLGQVHFDSPLLLAPMSGICNVPFRTLMEILGAGGTVSELISCHGINHQNQRTLEMLKLGPLEKNVGLQIFGEDEKAMALAAETVQQYGPKFVDINMGCPVRKVVNNGGGSALLKDTKKLSSFFKTIKRALNIPLTIKIRTGWDIDSINAPEVINIADGEGIEFVAIHGRTRTQQYKGQADWDLLESFNQSSPLPLIGNGDLHTYQKTRERMMTTKCQALMLARGPLRDPFIFLKSYMREDENIVFSASDFLEVIFLFHALLQEQDLRDRHHLTLLKKHIVWFAQGYPNVAAFRQTCFQQNSIDELIKHTEDFFGLQGNNEKSVQLNENFMAGGHG